MPDPGTKSHICCKTSNVCSGIFYNCLSFPRFLSGIHSSNGSPIEAFGDDDIEFAGKRNETLVILMRLPWDVDGLLLCVMPILTRMHKNLNERGVVDAFSIGNIANVVYGILFRIR